MNSQRLEILIPTCREEIDAMAAAIERHTPAAHIITTCNEPMARFRSAATNRNWCLARCKNPVAIMLDDDIEGFYDGWARDLLRPLAADGLTCMASARLLTPDGLPAFTAADSYDETEPWADVEVHTHRVLPTAAIAFRELGVKFDEEFLGSGWEDNDWCMQYKSLNPNFRFVQSNECRLVHRNEQKHQSIYWKHNKLYFCAKWLGEEAGLIRSSADAGKG